MWAKEKIKIYARSIASCSTRYASSQNVDDQKFRRRIIGILKVAKKKQQKQDPDQNNEEQVDISPANPGLKQIPTQGNINKEEEPAGSPTHPSNEKPSMAGDELAKSCKMRNRVQAMLLRARRKGKPFERALVGYDGPFTMMGLRGAMTTIHPEFAIPLFEWGRAQGGFDLDPRVFYCLMGTLRRGDLLGRGHKYVKHLGSHPEVQKLAYTGLYLNYLVAERKDDAERARKEMKRLRMELDVSIYGRLEEFRFKKDGLDGSLEVYREHLETNLLPDGKGILPLIERLCMAGRAEEAYKVFVETSGRGVEHLETGLRVLVNALIKAEKVDEALEVAEALKSKLGLRLTPASQTSLINKLSNFQRFEEAFVLLGELVELTGSARGVRLVIALCYRNKVDFALRVFNQVEEAIDEENQQALVLKLWNIGRREEARILFRRMLHSGLKPGDRVLAALNKLS